MDAEEEENSQDDQDDNGNNDNDNNSSDQDGDDDEECKCKKKKTSNGRLIKEILSIKDKIKKKAEKHLICLIECLILNNDDDSSSENVHEENDSSEDNDKEDDEKCKCKKFRDMSNGRIIKEILAIKDKKEKFLGCLVHCLLLSNLDSSSEQDHVQDPEDPGPSDHPDIDMTDDHTDTNFVSAGNPLGEKPQNRHKETTSSEIIRATLMRIDPEEFFKEKTNSGIKLFAQDRRCQIKLFY